MLVEWRRCWLYQQLIYRAISWRACWRVAQVRLSMSSNCRVEKNDSAGALSNALPVRPVERWMPSRRQALANASDVYWPVSSGRGNIVLLVGV